MPNLILDLSVDRVDLVDEGANSAAFIKLYKRKETENTMTFEEILAKMKPEHAAVIEEQISKSTTDLATAKADVETLTKEVNKAKQELAEQEIAKNKNAKPDLEEIMKGLDPAVQEVFKSLNAQKEAAEQVAKAAADKAEEDEANAKAEELKSLPVEKSKLVTVLKGITPEVYDILKSANQAIEDGGLFEEVGKSKDNAASTTGATANDAWDKIEKAAEVISAEQKVSKAKAISMAVKENPDLYREYLKGGAN